MEIKNIDFLSGFIIGFVFAFQFYRHERTRRKMIEEYKKEVEKDLKFWQEYAENINTEK
jgi:hypothetical protein